MELILITYDSIYSTLHKYTSSWLNLPLAPVAPTESSIQQSRTCRFYLSFIIAARYPKYAKYIYGLATIIIIGIGFSSIYVKAHWATDILAGYAVGYIWLLLCLALLKLSNPTNYKM